MPKQTPEQYAAFQELCRANHLDPRADVWQQKQSGQWIIGRTGIEKIQGNHNIAVSLDVVGFGLDYAGVKATATRTVKAEGAKVAKKLVVESLGSAHPKNCTQISYYLEMAEKRAKSRAILLLMGFYQLGIYGEDEAEAFQRPAEEAPAAQPAGNALGGSPIPSEPPVMPAASSSAAPAASTGAGPKSAEHQRILDDVRKLLVGATSTLELKALYDGLTKLMREQLQAEFTAAKQRIQAAVVQAGATPVARPVGRPAPEASNLKEAGDNTALVDALLPAEGEGPETMAPTEEMVREAHRLLNHPKIFRKEKTKFLLNINRLGYNQMREALGKLRGAITEREGYHTVTEAEQVGEVRAAIALLLKQHAGKLEIADEAQLRAALGNAQASLEELQAALRAGQEAAWDAESDGTERELAEVEADPTNPYT